MSMGITADDCRVLVAGVSQSGDRYKRRLQVVLEEIEEEIEEAAKLGMLRVEVYVCNCMDIKQLEEDEFIIRTVVDELRSNGFTAESKQIFDGDFYNFYISIAWAQG